MTSVPVPRRLVAAMQTSQTAIKVKEEETEAVIGRKYHMVNTSHPEE